MPKHEEQQTNNRYSEKKSIIDSLLKEYNNNKKQPVIEKSIARQLLNESETSAKLNNQNNDLKRSYSHKYVV